MTIEENILRIKEGKDNIINSLQQKGSTISADTLINDIPQFIENLPTSGGGGGSADLPPLEQKYENATCFRINVPTNNYEFSLNLCNDSSKANYDIDWGDGTIEYLNTSEQHHTYIESGTYDINVYNLTRNIMLGVPFSDTGYSYLFLNTNNLYWDGGYVIKDFPDICTDVIIGSNISEISQNSFTYLNELQSVIINDGVRIINNNAFSYTPNLKTLVLPQTLVSLYIQERMGIEELILPNSVTSLEQIRYCTNLKRVQFSDNLSNFTGLFECTVLEEVDLSNTKITSMGSDCFTNCYKLKKVILPDTITELGWQMFLNCKSLSYFVVPNGITKISYGCFFYCENLVQVELPSTLTYIENQAFYGTSGLQYIISHALVAPQIEDVTFEFNVYKNGYLYIHKDADIDSYTSDYWGEMLNYGWEIKYIEDIPTETTETTLKIKTKDNFPIEINQIYFADLIDRQLVDDEYVFTFDNVIDRLPKNIYPKNELIGITLPNTLQYILDNQFQNCNNLEYVVIPSSVTGIGNVAFQYCYNLNKIVCECMQAPIINSENWWEYPFTNMYRNGTLYIYEGAKGFDDVDSKWYNQLIQSLGWKIEYMEIKVPNNEIWYTTTDGNIVEPYALPTDNNLLSNTYENGIGKMTFENDITVLADAIFSQQTTLVSVKLPNTLTKINASTFNNCSKLESVNIPNSVTEIGNYAFHNLYELESIEIPEGVKKIGSNSFRSDIFESITLPSTISSIGNYAFSDMVNLYNITSLNPIAPTIQQFTFSNSGRYATQPKVLRIPEGSSGYEETTSQWYKQLILNGWTIKYIGEAPKNNEIWYKSGDGNIINPTHFDSLPTIVSNTYDTEKDMGKIVCESDITELGFECFDSNKDICEIVLPSQITNWNNYVFWNANNLYSIILHTKTCPNIYSANIWDNVGSNITDKEKVIYIPNDADLDSYLSNDNFVYVFNNYGFVLKNFDEEQLYPEI